MLGNIELTLTTPSTVEELAPYRDVLAFMFKFIPTTLTAQEAWEYLEYCVPHVTLAYANGVPVGFFVLNVYSTSVELHGVVRPDLHMVVPRANRFKNYIYSIMFHGIFNVMDKSKVIIKAPESNRDVFGFAAMHGFKRLQYKDKGELVWVLHKQDYLNRQRKVNVQGQKTES